MFNRKIQGWINYYTHFYKSEIYVVLRYINGCLVKWVRRKYKKRGARRKAEHWLGEVAKRDRNLLLPAKRYHPAGDGVSYQPLRSADGSVLATGQGAGPEICDSRQGVWKIN